MCEVEIEYCVPCGLLDNATMVQGHLLEEFGEALDRVSLVTGDAGIFEVRVGGEVVLDGQEERYDPETLKERVADRLDPVEASP